MVTQRVRAQPTMGRSANSSALRTDAPPPSGPIGRPKVRSTPPTLRGNAKRVLFGAIDLRSAHRVVPVRRGAGAADAQVFLAELRSRYRRAGRIWPLADRLSAHTARSAQTLAAQSNIQVVWLPKQRRQS